MAYSYVKFLKNAFNIKSRTRTSDYIGAILLIILQLPFPCILIPSITGLYPDHIVKIYETIVLIWALYNLIALFSISIRRLHDSNTSGYMMLLFVFLMRFGIGIIIYIYFMFRFSVEENNKYPPD